MGTHKIASGHRLLDILYEAGLIPDKTRRVIVDAKEGVPVRLYIEAFGDTQMFEMDWKAFKGAPVLQITDCKAEVEEHGFKKTLGG